MDCKLPPLAVALLCLGLTDLLAQPAPPTAQQGLTVQRPSAQPAAYPGSGANGPTCNAPLGWWESPYLNPVFPSGNPNAEVDCNFQVWSWTAFVHWMQTDPTTNHPRFLDLPTPDDLNSGELSRTMVKPRPLVLKPRNLKPQAMGEINQAGSGGVLVDQNGRAVYYATHMEPIYFATTQQYYGPEKYAKASPTTQYPVGATVFKTAWRIVPPGQTVNDAYTTQATIALLESDGKGGLKMSGQTQSDVTVALIGVHVVGVVPNHPEFLWATFEHAKNAPNLPPDMSPNSPGPVSDQSFTLYKANTPAVSSNQLPPSLAINPATQVISPITNVFRQFQFGGAVPAQRVTDIVQTNQNFEQHIAGGSTGSVSKVFANYDLHGTVWILAGTLQPGDGNLQFESIGSLNLASSVMETFVQGAGINCMTCHNTSAGSNYPGKDINFSHALLNAIPPNPEIKKAQ